MVVGAGAGDRQQISGPGVSREPDIAGDHVTSLTVPAHDGHDLGRAAGLAPDEAGSVCGAVQRGTRIVAHAPVDGDERTDSGDALHGQNAVKAPNTIQMPPERMRASRKRAL